MKIQRIKPNPIPAVYPVWEFEAKGSLLATDEEYKRAMQVPWVGVVTMAYAHYQAFFDTWWKALEPVCSTQIYIDTALALRDDLERRISKLSPPPIINRLSELGYSEREIKDIQNMIDVITHGNFIQIPAVFAARILLEGGELLGGREIGAPAKARKLQVETPLVLMEPHHGLGDLKTLYDDVKTTLDLPFVNTDYRCFARWPSYFDLAWADLREHIATPHYEAFVLSVHEAIFEATSNLPNPEDITSKMVKVAVEKEASVEEVLNTTRLFTWLIPGLVTNVAFFRAQLG